MNVRSATQGPFAPDEAARARLERRIATARALARRDGSPAYASVTMAIDPSIDLAATVLRGRRPGERFFCLEQTGRGGQTLACLGEAAAVTARGRGRFAAAARDCRLIAARTFADGSESDPQRPPRAGPGFAGGFAFAPDGGSAPEWAGFDPALLVLPAIAFARQDGEARLTVTVAVDADGEASVPERLAGLEPAEMPLQDPHPVDRPRVASAAPPSHYEEAVRRAAQRIRAGDLEKVVLAREVRVHAPSPIDPAPVFDGLRSAFGDCYCYCAGRGDTAFIGASPELLARRDGARAQTVALAGTTRRSADPAVDGHLGEQLRRSPKNRAEHAIVSRRIKRTLDPVSVWVSAAEEPVLVRVQNVQHLATPIRAQLAEPLSVVELAGRLHPTPAVGGEPAAAAEPLIPALEGLDRGWYAGAVGWTDLSEDGEFCVALRCALLHGSVAHLYAGCGIVGDSDPAEELAETEVKLQALLPLLV